jgi:hypothetical protein
MRNLFRLLALVGVLGAAALLGPSRITYAMPSCSNYDGKPCSNPDGGVLCQWSDGGVVYCTCASVWTCPRFP